MSRQLVSISLALVAAVTAMPAHAALKDHGPLDPVVTFPTWYRDLGGTPLQQCRSTVQSPNPAAALGPMCFPTTPTGSGFPGNIGPEIFYSDTAATVSGPNFTMKYVAALEAAYLSPLGDPQRGTEVVFGRIRIVISTTVPGTYKVTHPYGVEVFPDVGVGPRALFWTEDLTPIPGNFDAPLAGRIGPFLRWDFLQPGETLTVTNPLGLVEEFLGDPNYTHTFTGSPFGTNFIRVDGPPGSNLDGTGNDFVQTPLATILGQLYTQPIASPLAITRATYGRDPARGVTSIDVFATAPAAAKLILNGAGVPSVALRGDGRGRFAAHVELPVAAPLPSSVRVTNVTDVPASSQTATLRDTIDISLAQYDTLTKQLAVKAASSDVLAPPLLAVEGDVGGPMSAAGDFSALIASGVPPESVLVVSSAAGRQTAEVVIIPGLPDNAPLAPVAIPDTFSLNENTSATVSLTANDAVAPPAVPSVIYVLTAPASGTLTVNAAAPGEVTYTPNANFFGTDGFEYAVEDSAGNISNVAAVTLNVAFTAPPPTANPDSAATTQGTARTVAVLANDVAAAGTTIVATSVAIVTRPLHGNVVVNATGTVTYTPVAGWTGVDTFTYTVKNNAGLTSNAATVSITTATAEF
ncbi:MAG: Ig-like domain-containing protein, partial [Anaeromyxobacteraceae bacterium]